MLIQKPRTQSMREPVASGILGREQFGAEPVAGVDSRLEFGRALNPSVGHHYTTGDIATGSGARGLALHRTKLSLLAGREHIHFHKVKGYSTPNSIEGGHT